MDGRIAKIAQLLPHSTNIAQTSKASPLYLFVNQEANETPVPALNATLPQLVASPFPQPKVPEAHKTKARRRRQYQAALTVASASV